LGEYTDALEHYKGKCSEFADLEGLLASKSTQGVLTKVESDGASELYVAFKTLRGYLKPLQQYLQIVQKICGIDADAVDYAILKKEAEVGGTRGRPRKCLLKTFQRDLLKP
jgi:hypothetical protein